MKIGDLVIIKKENGWESRENIGQLAVITYLFENGEEVEVEIPSSNPENKY